MRYLIVFLISILTGFLFSKMAKAESPEDNSVLGIMDRVTRTQDVPTALLTAICTVESGEGLNLQAWAENDGGPGNHSFGACQVLLSTAEHLGFQDTGNRCRDYNTRQKAEYATCGLFGPVTNFNFAAKYLKYQLKRYNNNWTAAIAAYNSGSVKFCPPGGKLRNWNGKVVGTCQAGEFANQEYVNRVLTQLEKQNQGTGK